MMNWKKELLEIGKYAGLEFFSISWSVLFCVLTWLRPKNPENQINPAARMHQAVQMNPGTQMNPQIQTYGDPPAYFQTERNLTSN